MNDFDDLLDRIETPQVDVGDDVARGERALRRRRRWQVSGVAMSAAAVMALATLTQTGDGRNGSTSPDVATRATGTALPSPPPKASQSAQGSVDAMDKIQTTLDHYRDVLVEHLDPAGHDLGPANNYQTGSLHGGPTLDSVGTKLDWRGGGMLEISVSTSWPATAWNSSGTQPGQHIQYLGHPARVLRRAGRHHGRGRARGRPGGGAGRQPHLRQQRDLDRDDRAHHAPAAGGGI